MVQLRWRGAKKSRESVRIPGWWSSEILEIVAKGELLFPGLDQGRAINTEAGAAGNLMCLVRPGC